MLRLLPNSVLLLAQSSLLFLFLSAFAVQAQDAHSLALKIDSHYNHLSTLKADFSEHYRGMGMDRTESGTVLMKKPGRMRWSYNAPTGKLFILDGKFAYSYTPGDSQAGRTPAKKLDDMRSPLRLLLGHTQLEKELANLTLTPTPQGFRLTGQPKYQQQGMQSLELEATSDGVIQSIRIEQEDGGSTEFHFTHMEENIPLRDSEFAFDPPPGVIVVDALPPM